jgi:hypothetical protein
MVSSQPALPANFSELGWQAAGKGDGETDGDSIGGWH